MEITEAVTKVLTSCDLYVGYLDDVLKHTPFSEAGSNSEVNDIREAINMVEDYFVNKTEILDHKEK
jgi:hypothetical protein